MKSLKYLRPLLLSVILGACASVGPDYQPPAQTGAQQWHTDLKDGLKNDPVNARQLETWWEVFDDPLLSRLIHTAINGNRDLQQAEARVREARARRGISSAGRFPTLDVSAMAANTRTSASTGLGKESDLYTAGFDAAWELDLFGGIRRSVEVADANLQASRADLQAVRVSLTAEVAINYLEVRTFQTRLDVAEANITAQQKTFELITSRFNAGLSNDLAVQQARYNLEITRSQIPYLRSGLEAAKNRLAILTGQPPGSMHEHLADRRPIV